LGGRALIDLDKCPRVTFRIILDLIGRLAPRFSDHRCPRWCYNELPWQGYFQQATPHAPIHDERLRRIGLKLQPFTRESGYVPGVQYVASAVCPSLTAIVSKKLLLDRLHHSDPRLRKYRQRLV